MASFEAHLRPAAGRARAGVAPARWAFAGLVFLVALVVLLALHGGGHAYRLARPAAVRAALADPQVREHLATHRFTRAEVHAFDERSQRVSFLAGPRLVLDAAVDDSGRVEHVAPRFPGVPPSGALVTFNPLLWLAMAAVLALAAGAARLRSLRTLDLAALLALLAPIACYRDGLVGATVLAALPSLSYLVGRCAWVALRGAPAEAPPSLYDRLTAAWEPGRGTRLLVLLTGAVAVMVAMVSITSNSPSDVDLASMSGATLLLHGTLPYGHMPSDVVHGDTYPLLNYVLHVPAALLAPVRDGFDDLTGGQVTAVLAALAAAAGLGVAGARSARSRSAGLRLGLAWLAFPPVVMAASAGTNDLLLAACLAWALAWSSRAGRGGLLLGAAAWVKLLPIALAPFWLARLRGAELRRALAALAAVSAAALALMLALGGPGGVGDMVRALSFQLERGSLYSVWQVLGIGGLQVVAQAGLLAFVAMLALRARHDAALAADPRRLAAAAGAVLIGLQLTANYWTYAYLPWAVVCVAAALLADGPGREPVAKL